MPRNKSLFLFLFLLFGYISAKGNNGSIDSLYASGLKMIELENICAAKSYFLSFYEKRKGKLNSHEQYYATEAIAYCYYRLSDIDSALIYNDDFNFKPIDYHLVKDADSLYDAGFLHIHLEEYNSALSDFNGCLSMQASLLGNEHLLVGRTLDQISYIYSLQDNYSSAISYKQEALNIYKKYYPANDAIIIGTRQGLINLYDYTGDFNDALRLAKENLSCMNSSDKMFINTRWKISRYLSYLGKYEEALDFEKESNRLCKDTIDVLESDYNLCEYYSALGQIDEAFNIMEKAIKLCQNINVSFEERAVCENLMANLYATAGDFNKALEYGLHALSLREKLYTTHRDLALSYNNVARYYSSLGLLDEALYYQGKTMSQYIALGDSISPEMAACLNNYSEYYEQLGDYHKAIELQERSLSILNTLFGTSHPDYAISLNNLAKLYADIKNYPKAISLNEDVLAIRKRLFGSLHPDVATTYSNLSSCYLLSKDYKHAIEYEVAALNIYRDLLGTSNADYAVSLSQLGNIYKDENELDSAIISFKNAQNIFYQLFGKRSNQYIDCSKELADLYTKVSNTEMAQNVLDEVYNLLQDQVLTTFYGMSSYERTQFWNKNKKWFYVTLPSLCLRLNNAYANSLLYNSTLMTKSILLAADVEIDKIVESSNEESLINEWSGLKRLKAQVSYLFTKKDSSSKSEIDSLYFMISAKEREVLKRINRYSDFSQNFRVTWNDIEKRLSQNSIAIELILIPSSNGSGSYYALMIRKGVKAPHMVKLCPSSALKSLDFNTILSTDSLSKLIWGNIRQDLNGIDTIYFAPTGMLYNIPLEYLAYDSKRLMSEVFHMRRLSSTREIALSKTISDYRTVALYGGLYYDASRDSLIEQNKLNGFAYSQNYHATRSYDIQQRAGVGYLYGSLEEIDTISNNIPRSICQLIYTENRGTEESFKNLPLKYTNLIHLDTHGFYWRDSISKDKGVALQEYNSTSIGMNEDRILSRTGLLMSGANIVLKGGTMPSNMDDGILTSREISKLDFHSVDLVVLAACETGLGDLESDGVIGLQRAFKKSGAKSLLVSLWKVDNNATILMMSQFYKNLFNGKSKYSSLKRAIKYVKDFKDSDGNLLFSSPYYWAGFVLID